MAHALHPEDEAAAAAWIKPLKEKLLDSQGVKVIEELDQLLNQLQGSGREVVQAERNYLDNNRERLLILIPPNIEMHTSELRGDCGSTKRLNHSTLMLS